jgi:hypothetical protein
MRLALLIVALCAPSLAMAEPATIATIAAFVTAYGVYIQLALVVVMTAYGNYQQRKAKAKARRDYNAGLEDRLATDISTDRPHLHVYGTARVGGGIVGMFASGDKDQYKHIVIVHAAHECTQFLEYYINGKPVGALDANGYPPVDTEFNKYVDVATYETTIGGESGSELVSTQVITSTPNPTVKISSHLGALSDTVDAGLHAALPTLWPSTAVLRGFCYSVVRLDLNNSEFQGRPPSIDVLIKGKKVYDPRSGSTAYSENPAMCVRDYLTGPMCSVPATDIPESYFIAAANACDELIPFVKNGVTTQKPRYTLNGTVTSDQAQQDVLQSMVGAMAGSLVSTTWEIFAGKFAASTAVLNQTDIVGAVSVSPGSPDTDKFNGVKIRYAASENGYVATDATPYQNAAYLAADGRDLFVDMSLPWTGDLQRAHNLCRIYTEDNRQAYTIQADFSLKAWGLKVGERVQFTSPLFGITAKTFRVIGKSFSPSTAVKLVLKEDAASIWDLADEAVIDATPNTNLPNPFNIAKIVSLTADSGTAQLLVQSDGTVVSRIKVTWPQLTNGTILANGVIDVEYNKLPYGAWQKVQVAGAETVAYLDAVNDGFDYAIRARARDVSLNAASDWTYSALHRVVGKTEPPPNVQGLQAAVTSNGILLSWYPVPADVVDYDTTAIQRGTAWGAQANLTQKTSTTHLVGWLPAGANTFLAKHIDTTGNASTAAASATVTIVSPATPLFTKSEVEENILALQWQDCATSQPLKRLIYKTGTASDTFASAVDYGTDGGAQRVTLIKFNTPGARRIFVAAEDVGGNISTPAIIDVVISLPRNYVLSGQYTSTFTGAMTDAHLFSQGGILMLVPQQTWAQHYALNGWANSAAQVAAGYPLYFQPGTNSAQYVEDYDLGKVLSSSTIAFTRQYQWLAGGGGITPTISYRETPASAWINVVDAWSTIASNFRYMQITINVTATGGASLLQLQSLNCNVSLREVTESVMFTSNSVDAAGTLYTLRRPILDITAQGFTPMGTAAAYVDVIPDDSISPAAVRVKAWDAALNRVTVQGNLIVTGTSA